MSYTLQARLKNEDLAIYDKIKNKLKYQLRDNVSDGFVVRWLLRNLDSIKVESINVLENTKEHENKDKGIT
ncbi:MAG: hypothetical protein O9310_09180 [Leptospiraceae bacterium]|jgi:hypothetical protein|nr:hypothetical protein [Leptospiraceae bacterium]